jgi:RNA polymerase sigma-70 factor (ECF subfamily)
MKLEALNELAAALAKLPDDQKEAVVLRYLTEISVSEIAAIMGRSEASVAGLVRRGLEAIRPYLRKLE